IPMRVSKSQPTQIQFVNNFWGASPEKSFEVITIRIKDSLNTLNEIVNFYHEKINIEREYTKKLEKLQHKFCLGSHETGTMKQSLDKLVTENQSMIDNNHKFIKTITHVNAEKLQTFQQLYLQRVNKLQYHMNKVIIKRQQALKELNHYKSKYKEECISLKSLRLSLQTTWGRELDKNQQKYNKINALVATTRQNYHVALVNFKEINEIYKRDWNISLNDFYKLEVERIQVIKINCFNYCNNIATLCVDQDQAVDLARPLFAQVQPPADIEEFSGNYGTGNKIYDDPEFVDYMNGCEEPQIGYTISNFASPDCSALLSRTYSSHSRSSSPTKSVIPTPYQEREKIIQNTEIQSLPPSAPTTTTTTTAYVPRPVPPAKDISQQPIPKLLPTRNTNKTPSPVRKPPSDYQSTYSDDIFSKDERLQSSNGSSDYSSERNWASPRRKEKQLQEVQEQISRRATNDFKYTPKAPEPEKVPVIKDFSIDFIAKALEDLNSGGDGDVNQFRRSLRNGRPKSDFIDDRNEVAQRYESISFNRPKSLPPRKKSLKLTPINKKSYITKAEARYNFKPQHEGELFFKKGWQMYILHKQEDNWFVCELSENCGTSGGMIGLIPGNYIIEGDDLF
ncbi:Cell division control protein, putative, partial [Candida maltosa Xu316]